MWTILSAFSPSLNGGFSGFRGSFFVNWSFFTNIAFQNLTNKTMTGEFVLRIFIATLLGAIIGIDREYRTKAAGFRTHVLVALGSALFMIISVHGFDYEFFANQSLAHEDNMRDHLNALRLDPARIAAQVVTGIGFIGAGTIILQKNVVRGLTTAAGLWVTAAIGMACGVGMYVVAAVSTTLVMICYEAFNFFLHKMHKKAREEDKFPDE